MRTASDRPESKRWRSLPESLSLILRHHGQSILVALFVVSIGLVLGVLVQEIQSRYVDLGAATIVALVVFALAAVAVALAFPVLSLVACIAVAFSSSSAVLYADYGLPVLSKYLPLVLFGAIAVHGIRRSRNALVPRSLWLAPRRSSAFPTPFLLCLSLLGVYYLFTLLSLLYATNTAFAFEELNLQDRRLLLCLAVALAVGQFGRWSSLANLCTIALYACTAAIFIAALGSFYPPLETLLPGFASVTETGVPDEAADRIAGAFGHPNTLGRYAVFVMPLAVGLASVRTGVHRLAAIACLPILMAGVVLSESRGALLVLAVVALPALALAVRTVKARHWLPAIAIGVVVILVAWQYVDTERMSRSVEDAERLLTDGSMPSDGATRGRLSEMLIAYELWRAHPILGVGLANYEHYFQTYSHNYGTKLYNTERAAHSLYLELLAERGIAGLLGFMIAIGGIFLTVLHYGVRTLRDGDRTNGRLALSMVVAALTYYMSAAILHDVHSSPIWALTGLMIAATRQAAPPTRAGGRERGVATGIRNPLL